MTQDGSYFNSFAGVKWQDLLSPCLSICPHFLPHNHHSADVTLTTCISHCPFVTPQPATNKRRQKNDYLPSPVAPSVGAVTLPSPVRDETNCVAFCLQLRNLFQNLDRRRPACRNTATWGQKVSDSTTHFKWQLVFLACLITSCAFLKAICVCEGVHQHNSILLAQYEVGQKNYARQNDILYKYCWIHVDICSPPPPHSNDYPYSSSTTYSR